MSYSVIQLLSKYHSFFNNENICAETETKIDFISSIWDDHILRLDKNKYHCLWCNTIFQGINANKALAHVLGKKGMNIKSCHVPKYKAHIKRYKDIQQYKQAWKGVLD